MPARPAALVALPVAALLAVVALAGCTASNSPDGQAAGGPGSLAYNGASTGNQQSQAFDCGGSATVHATSNLGSGKVTVTVKGGAGKAVYTRTFESPGQGADEKAVSGTAGDWTISATRTGSSAAPGAPSSFSGQYAVHVEC